MKKFLFLALILIVTCEAIKDDSENTVEIYKCLLLDSDVTFNYINSLIDAVEKMDAVKLASLFITIYPAIGAEFLRCKTQTKEVINLEGVKEKAKINIIELIIKVVKEYLIPILKKIIANFADLCKMFFPESPICDLFN